ncbi:MAG: hypothetical protein ACXVDB_02330 [Tumebacillaceae bacterium]
MKKYVWIGLLVLVLLAVGGVFVIDDIVGAQYTDAQPAAQVALDTTVLDKIDSGEPYTGGMNGFVFTGHDKLGRGLYVWTEGQKVVAMQYASAGLTKDKAIAAAKKPVLAKTVTDSMKGKTPEQLVDVIHATPGPVLSRMFSDEGLTEFRTAESKYVWEVYGKLANGKYAYTYLDFKSGQVVWQFALDAPK